jgi:hypothetical protein
MRRTVFHFLSSIALLSATVAADINYAPFADPLFGLSDESLLVKRQGCALGADSCSDLGAQEACCPPDTTCTLDQAGHVACCPYGAACTGTIDITITGTQSTSFIPTPSTTSFIPTTSSTAFETPTITTGVVGGGATVPNTYGVVFNFIPTSYANRQACETAFSVVDAQETECLRNLAGVNGVTITGVGFGTTVQGQTGTIQLLESAGSVCSALSSSAVYGLESETCRDFRNADGVNAGPRQTPCPGVLYAAGAVAGAVGVGALI